jgi:hypothetical protein
LVPLAIGLACNFPLADKGEILNAIQLEPMPHPELPKAEVEFRVQVPAGTPAEDRLYLGLLDEVTGLALNATYYPMEAQESEAGGPRVYALKLGLPMGAAVQYRYERESAATRVNEHVSDGRPVRYRVYHVEGPGSVQDVVSRWTDTPFSGPTGRIMGVAVDGASGQPIANLLVTAGGAQTLTTADGTFIIEGLPEGVHNLVAYALDGSHRTFQQGARVASQSTTPAELRMTGSPQVQVSFLVEMPEGTPPIVPVRLAGNLYQLGNTFANLEGGVSTVVTNMPFLTRQPDGRYALDMELPAGTYVRYKYTLGDGFWNSERTAEGKFNLREIVVPQDTLVIEDKVESWEMGDFGAITFDVNVPENTPSVDTVFIQLNPVFGWTEPIPMWPLGEGRWAYILYSPLNLPGELGYRFCRNGQCGRPQNGSTAGEQSESRSVKITDQPQTVKGQISAWSWLGSTPAAYTPGATVPPIRGAGFMAGMEFTSAYHPNWRARLPMAYDDAQNAGAAWVVLSPTWTYTRNMPPLIEPVAGQDMSWYDLVDAADQAAARELNIAIFPNPRFPVESDAWWQSSERDFGWWLVWFDQYRKFLLHHADLASRSQVQALVLGGDWLTPATSVDALADGTPSGVPADYEQRWRNLIHEVRAHYKGTVLWAIPYRQIANPPAFLDEVDKIYLTLAAPLASGPDSTAEEMETAAVEMLDGNIKTFQARFNKPLVLAAAYGAANGAATGCVPDIQGTCLSLETLLAGKPDYSAAQPDPQEQADAYQALLNAASQREWIAGLVARGYFPPAVVQDLSPSVHGKPAEEVLRYWFPRLLGSVQ